MIKLLLLALLSFSVNVRGSGDIHWAAARRGDDGEGGSGSGSSGGARMEWLERSWARWERLERSWVRWEQLEWSWAWPDVTTTTMTMTTGRWGGGGKV